MINSKKLHWYCFSFLHSNVIASSFKGFKEKDKINISDINNARNVAEINGKSVLISLAYLGHMTKEEFTNE